MDALDNVVVPTSRRDAPAAAAMIAISRVAPATFLDGLASATIDDWNRPINRVLLSCNTTLLFVIIAVGFTMMDRPASRRFLRDAPMRDHPPSATVASSDELSVVLMNTPEALGSLAGKWAKGAVLTSLEDASDGGGSLPNFLRDVFALRVRGLLLSKAGPFAARLEQRLLPQLVGYHGDRCKWQWSPQTDQWQWVCPNVNATTKAIAAVETAASFVRSLSADGVFIWPQVSENGTANEGDHISPSSASSSNVLFQLVSWIGSQFNATALQDASGPICTSFVSSLRSVNATGQWADRRGRTQRWNATAALRGITSAMDEVCGTASGWTPAAAPWPQNGDNHADHNDPQRANRADPSSPPHLPLTMIGTPAANHTPEPNNGREGPPQRHRWAPATITIVLVIAVAVAYVVMYRLLGVACCGITPSRTGPSGCPPAAIDGDVLDELFRRRNLALMALNAMLFTAVTVCLILGLGWSRKFDRNQQDTVPNASGNTTQAAQGEAGNIGSPMKGEEDMFRLALRLGALAGGAARGKIAALLLSNEAAAAALVASLMTNNFTEWGRHVAELASSSEWQLGVNQTGRWMPSGRKGSSSRPCRSRRALPRM